MIKIYMIVWVIFLLCSCFYEKSEEKIQKNLPMKNIEIPLTKMEWVPTGKILPMNEKTTQAEKDFSHELNNLLDTIDEKPNEK